jgi:hypothetical protein
MKHKEVKANSITLKREPWGSMERKPGLRFPELCRSRELLVLAMKLPGFMILVLVLVLSLLAVSARADILGTAAPYAVIAGSTVTNPTTNAATIVFGSMAVSPGSTCTGFAPGTPDICTFGPGVVTGFTDLGGGAGTAIAAAAEADDDNAELALLADGPAIDLTGSTLGVAGDATLAPGVYSFSSLVTAGLDGTLTLDGGSDLHPLWIFQIGRDLTTAAFSSVVVTGAGAAAAGVYWVTGTQATLGNSSTFQGNILAGSAIVLDPGAQITCGRAFADTAVNFAGNDPASSVGVPNLVNSGPCTVGTTSGSPNGNDNGVFVTLPGGGTGVGSGPPVTPGAVPEPGSCALLATSVLGALLLCRKFRWVC